MFFFKKGGLRRDVERARGEGRMGGARERGYLQTTVNGSLIPLHDRLISNRDYGLTVLRSEPNTDRYGGMMVRQAQRYRYVFGQNNKIINNKYTTGTRKFLPVPGTYSRST